MDVSKKKLPCSDSYFRLCNEFYLSDDLVSERSSLLSRLQNVEGTAILRQ